MYCLIEFTMCTVEYYERLNAQGRARYVMGDDSEPEEQLHFEFERGGIVVLDYKAIGYNLEAMLYSESLDMQPLRDLSDEVWESFRRTPNTNTFLDETWLITIVVDAEFKPDYDWESGGTEYNEIVEFVGIVDLDAVLKAGLSSEVGKGEL